MSFAGHSPTTASIAYAAAVVGASRVVTIVVDASADIAFAAGGTDVLLGRRAEELAGMGMLDLIWHEDLDDAVSAFSDGLTVVGSRWHARPLPMTIRLTHADGSPVRCDVLTTNAVDTEHLGGFVFTVIGVADRVDYSDPIEASLAGEPLDAVMACLARGAATSTDRRWAAYVLHRPSSGGLMSGSGLMSAVSAAGPAPEFGELLAKSIGEGYRGPWEVLSPGELAVFDVDTLPEIIRDAAHAARLQSCRLGALVCDGHVEGALLTMMEGPEPLLMPMNVRQRLRHLTDLGSLILSRARAEERLVHAATHDGLTGLANRATFFDRLERHAERGDEVITVLYVDVDDFKRVNDEHGHTAGDHVLIEVARRMEQSCRPGDLVGRLGGDEFAVALLGATGADAAAVAARLVDAVAAPLPEGCGVEAVSVSVGMARARSMQSVDEYVEHADRAMLAAKRAGRARVAVA